MESPALASLRREVRQLVHRTCRQRWEGDAAAAQEALDSEIARLLARQAGDGVDEATVRGWVAADEADFDRAVLISDLVASRIGAAGATTKPSVAGATVAPPATPAAAPARSRPPAGTVPGIADMLDDMLTQQKPRKARSA